MAYILSEHEEKKFSKINPKIKPLAEMLKLTLLDELPQNPKVGKWYRYTPDGCICANGEKYHGCIKIGKENKFGIYLMGGGVSINEYTAARPSTILGDGYTPNFYSEDSFMGTDIMTSVFGIFSNDDNNPFKDWTMVIVSYASGDFHAGNNDYPYMSVEGEKRTLYHHGYKNAMAIIDKARSFCVDPEKVLVTGSSAGGFGTSLIAGDIFDKFPKCNDFTAYNDSGLFKGDFKKIAENVWKTPKSISDRFVGEYFVLDSLVSLSKRYENAKILFSCSVCDAALATYQEYLDSGVMETNEESRMKIFGMVKDFCLRFQKEIKNSAIFLFDTPTLPTESYSEKKCDGLTHHCVCGDQKIVMDGKTNIKWLDDCVNGNLYNVGRSLIENDEPIVD